MLKDELKSFIESTISNNPHSKEAFYVLDLGTVAALIDRWNRNFPSIRPFYAVKCNTTPPLLEAMAATGGLGFDCASQAEIETILSYGVSPDMIIYANPCKIKSHIEYAASVGVNLTTFDSVHEIEKIRTSNPNSELLVRIRPPEGGADKFSMCEKYGALPEEFETLLRTAQRAKVKVIGVSFHIGTEASNPQAYKSCIRLAKTLFDLALRLGMPPMHLLNIGGGFSSGPIFEEMASVIKSAIGEYFDGVPNLKLIAEPGRYFVETAVTLVANIIGKRVRGDLREYWINDGIYGSLNCVLNDPTRFLDIVPLASPTNLYTKMWRSTIFGPTCCGLDKVAADRKLPEMEVDEWLIFPNMGAYDATIRSNFNGFKIDITTYVLKP